MNRKHLKGLARVTITCACCMASFAIFQVGLGVPAHWWTDILTEWPAAFIFGPPIIRKLNLDD